MSAIKIKRGLNLPISGSLTAAEPVKAPVIKHVALLPQEAVGIKTKLICEVGDTVKIGSPLFFDKRSKNVLFTSPAAGEVLAIHRGHRRSVQSVVVMVDESDDQVDFGPFDASKSSREDLVAFLCRTGFWPTLRQRPFGIIPDPASQPQALVVTAADTRPLAPEPQDLLKGRQDHFRCGLAAVQKLTSGPTWLCTHGGKNWESFLVDGVMHQEFSGPHPAGNAGVHIHHLAPAGPKATTWHIDYQDVADLGEFLNTGMIPTHCLVALVGPGVRQPKLLRTRKGSATGDLCALDTPFEKPRFISGSALGGRICPPSTETGYLGRYSNMITVLDDQPKRRFLDWLHPFGKQHTVTNTLVAKFSHKTFDYNTDLNGGLRAIVPIGSYEEVMPMDILATQLFRALAANDLGASEKLGALELSEEDLALCEYVCPSKIEFGALLRTMLTRIQKEG
jgi:Na+-transporting NADH:ubiquinone oxidoreductase subunit A